MAERAETNIRQIVHRGARWYPTNEAVVDGVQRLTYAELQDQVRRMAALFHSLGVRKGDRVALLMHPSAAHVIALFGAIELGAIPCALHLRESAELLEAVVERLSPRVLVYDAALDELAGELRRRVPLITGAVRAASAISPPEKLESGSDPLIPRDLARWEMDFEPMPIAEDETAAIVLSSGTTGVPKGIMHSHRALVESARGGAQLWRINARSSIINLSTTAFIGWYNCALPFLNACAKLVFQNQWDPQQYLETCQREQTTVAFLVPTMWRMVMKLPVEDYDLGAIRLAGYAGEPIDAGTLRAIQERVCPDVLNMYGTTETGSCAGGTVLYAEDITNERRLASVGKPFLNADVRIVRPGGSPEEEVAPGEEGEVLIRGPSVAREVWEQPEVARRIFDGPWWRSGDLGGLDEEGFLYLHGRVDDMIVSGGINILPNEIEESVMNHPLVVEAAAIGIPDAERGQRVMAVVVTSGEVSPEELDTHVLGTGLSRYKRPREFEFMDELPRGNTGKLNRRLLREQILRKRES